jgi:hypothetical protein
MNTTIPNITKATISSHGEITPVYFIPTGEIVYPSVPNCGNEGREGRSGESILDCGLLSVK